MHPDSQTGFAIAAHRVRGDGADRKLADTLPLEFAVLTSGGEAVDFGVVAIHRDRGICTASPRSHQPR
jgi:hypothetical protein